MNTLPATPIAIRLNALAAAAVVTLTMLVGIDSLAIGLSAVPQMAQTTVAQPA